MKKLSFISTILLTFILSNNFSSASEIMEAEEVKQSTSPICQLPNYLKNYIFSYLNATEGFIQLSHTNHDLRNVAFEVAKFKSIDISHRTITADDYKALIIAPFSRFNLRLSNLNIEFIKLIHQSNYIEKTSDPKPIAIEGFGFVKIRFLKNIRKYSRDKKFLVKGSAPALTSLNLSENNLSTNLHEIKSLNLTSLDLLSNNKENCE